MNDSQLNKKLRFTRYDIQVKAIVFGFNYFGGPHGRGSEK
jgi:hypothetical protein